MRLLVTGGAGFIGASVCIGLAERHPKWRINAVDNLERRGSELNLPRLRLRGSVSSKVTCVLGRLIGRDRGGFPPRGSADDLWVDQAGG